VLLGSFTIASDRLVVELAQMEGGGEGVLISLASLAKRYMMLRKLSGVKWIIHAVTCAKPNLKLRRMLEHRGFVVKNVDGGPSMLRLRITANAIAPVMSHAVSRANIHCLSCSCFW